MIKVEVSSNAAGLIANLLEDVLVKLDGDYYVEAPEFRQLIEAFENERVVIVGIRGR